MSYVLDALRKAEGERRKSENRDAGIFDESIWSAPPESGQASKKWRLATFTLLAMVLFALLVAGLARVAPFWDFVSYQKPSPPATTLPLAAENLASSSQAEIVKYEIQAVEVQVQEVPVNSAVTPVTGNMHSIGQIEMRLEGVIYVSQSSAANRALIDGGMYRRGDQIRPGLILADIFEDRVVVTRDQERLEFFIQ